MRVLADPAVTQPGQQNSSMFSLFFIIDAMLRVAGEKCIKYRNIVTIKPFVERYSDAEKSATRNVMSLYLSLSHYQ